MFGAESSQKLAPHVRVITSTEYRLDEATAFFTEDITVDSDGDAQLFVDALFVDDEGQALPSRDPEHKSFSPFFYVCGEDRLITHNMRNFTPIFGINASIGSDKSSTDLVIPFGKYQNIEDRIAALEWASGIVYATEHTDLVAWNTGAVDE